MPHHLTPAASSQALTTVVFDIGNVLLDWDPRHLYRTIFADPAEMAWFLAHVCTPDWNIAQDKGRPWAEAEAEAVARHPGYASQIYAFRARWPETVSGPITGTVAILDRLARAHVPLYAITNFASDTFRQAQQHYAFLRLFRGVVVSDDLGILKPDPAIYQRLAAEFGVDLTRCVFIDDSEKNVAGARAVGMTAIHFSTPAHLAKELVALPNAHPGREYEVECVCPEFTCVCPMTGQPDFATFTISYVPGPRILELKSLKLYLWSYRDEGAFHEAVTNQICDDLVAATKPKSITVTGRFGVRGGIETTVTVTR